MARNPTTERAPQEPMESARPPERPGWHVRARRRLFSDGSLTKKASLNAVAQALDYAARALAGLIVNPILLRYLGDSSFGTWQVLQRLIGHAAPAGGRPAEALKWFIANRQASDDTQHKRQAVGSALAVWLVFLPVLVPLGLVVAWFAPIWLHADPASYWTIRVAAIALIADLIIAGITNIPWAVMAGQNVGYKRMGLTASLEFVASGFLIVAVVVHGGLIGIAIAAAAGTAVIGTVYYRLARIYVPWFGYARPDRSAVRRFLGLSWWFLLWNFVMKVTMGGDIIVLGIAGSASEVTVYTLTRFIPITVMAGVTSMIFGMAPGLGGLIGAGEVPRAARVRNETMAASWLMATIACAGVLMWLPTFLGLWVGHRYYPGITATVLIAVMIVQLTLIRVDSNIIDLTLNLRRKTLLGLLSAGLSVAIAWVLVSTFELGISGVVTGFIVGRIVQTLAYPAMVGRILAIPRSEQFRGAARAAAATAVLFAVTAAVGRLLLVHSWIGLILGAGVTAVILALCAFFLGLSRRQRIWLWERGRRIARLR
jgi:O-antigen/teichoic acid export membrane protein